MRGNQDTTSVLMSERVIIICRASFVTIASLCKDKLFVDWLSMISLMHSNSHTDLLSKNNSKRMITVE